MNIFVCLILGMLCLIYNKQDGRSIMEEIVDVIVYLFVIMIAVYTIDVLYFGEQINVIENNGRIFRVIANGGVVC